MSQRVATNSQAGQQLSRALIAGRRVVERVAYGELRFQTFGSVHLGLRGPTPLLLHVPARQL